MLLVSTGFKSLLLGPQSFAQIFAGGELRLFAGGRPASANRAQGANLIGTVRRVDPLNTGLQFVLVDSYVIKPPQDVWQLLAQTNGTVAWWRLVALGDTGTDSTTAARIDGDIGTAAAPSDMTLSLVNFNANQALPIDSFLYTIPPLGA